MSKIAIILTFALFLGLTACQEDKVVHSTEPVAIVQIPPLASGETIDWNQELAFVQSDHVRQKAAVAAGVDPDDLEQAVRIEADITNQQLRILGPHAHALAQAYTNERLNEQLSKLESQLEKQEEDFEQMNDAPAVLDSDKMTYEKALEALEEAPADDGILYRKSDE